MSACESVLYACSAMSLMGSSANTFLKFPTLERPENNVLLLLTWSTMVSSRQLRVLSDWACSAEGWTIHA